jgi:hypothetical protein
MSSNKFKEVPICLINIEDVLLDEFYSIVYDELGEAIDNDNIELHDEILIVLRRIKTEIQNRKMNLELTHLLEHIELSISLYDNEFKHTEYSESIGKSVLQFISGSQNIINENKYTYDLFIKSLDIKFPNILIIKSTPYTLHYKLKGKLNV